MNLEFSSPTLVKTPQGSYYRQSAYPTKLFWKAWRNNREALREAGLYVVKEDNVYIVYRNSNQSDIKKPIPTKSDFKLNYTKEKLLPYQVPLVGELCASVLTNNLFVDASDAGIGKTYHAMAVCRELSLRPAVITTKTNILSFKKVIKYFGLNPLFVVNWESIIAREYKKTKEVKCSFPYIEVKRSSYTGKIYYDWKIPKGNNNIILIFDEAHKGNGMGTSQGKVFLASKPYRRAFLSATLAGSPWEFRNLGIHLGIFKYENFTTWLQNLGCVKSEYGAKWDSVSPRQDMVKISESLFPKFGGRLRKKDIPNFPDIQNIAESYPIKDVKKFNKAYQGLVLKLEDLESKKASYQKEKQTSNDETRLSELVSLIRKAQADKLTLNLRYRQFTELLKVDLFCDLAKQCIDNNGSVAIFVNFTETLEALSKKLKCKCLVHGGQTGKRGMNERQKSIDDFQTNKSRIIICNIAAGGIGISLHDLTGLYHREAIISPTHSAKQLVQVLGRIHRSGAKSKAINRLVYAGGTIEEDVCENVSSKIDAINALNDADLAENDIFNLMKG
jgi:superfamily II DNA or RNA helicase